MKNKIEVLQHNTVCSVERWQQTKTAPREERREPQRSPGKTFLRGPFR